LRDTNYFFLQLVTMEETWLYHNDLETKQRSIEWGNICSPHTAPKIQRLQEFAQISRLPFFCNQDGIPHIDQLPKGQTINVEYYVSLLGQLKDLLKKKSCGNVSKWVLFLHDIAATHWALATQKKVAYQGFCFLDHPLFSPDLAPLK